jgi:hypothetical protein
VDDDRTFTEEEYARAQARIDALMPWGVAWRSTVVILIVRGNSLQVFGSGTLLSIDGESLLVTAGHVIEDAGAQNLTIIRADQTQKDDIIPLEGEAVVSPRDKLDIAVLRLKPEVAARFDKGDFLRLEQTCRDRDLAEAMFAVIGFPEIMSGIEGGILKFTKFHHVAPSFVGKVSGLKLFDSRIHFLVDADLSETRLMDGKFMEFKDRSGEHAQFPGELGGISGGSVWKLGDNPKDCALRKPGSGRLVGVAVAAYEKSRCIRASRWSDIIDLLRVAMPDLRQPIDSWRGK